MSKYTFHLDQNVAQPNPIFGETVELELPVEIYNWDLYGENTFGVIQLMKDNVELLPADMVSYLAGHGFTFVDDDDLDTFTFKCKVGSNWDFCYYRNVAERGFYIRIFDEHFDTFWRYTTNRVAAQPWTGETVDDIPDNSM